MHDSLDSLRKRFREVGGGLTVVSALMTGVFGWSMGSNWVMGLILGGGLMCATFASAYAWPFVAAAYRDRQWGTFAFLAAFAVLCTGTDLSTNFGSIAWQRTADVDTALKQDVVHDERTEGLKEGKTNLALWQKQLADLEAANAWAPTVTALGLREQIPALDEAIRQETKRGGCGPKCLSLQREKAAIGEKIGVAERRDDLTAKIAATKRVVDSAREVAVTTKKGESATRDMNLNLASMFTLSLAPTAEAQHWTNKGVAWLVAAFFAFGAMGCNFVGWGIPRGRESETIGRSGSSSAAPTQSPFKELQETVMDRYEAHCKTHGYAPVGT
jgi:hypothetical protein